MKPEQEIGKFAFKIWVIFITAVATGYYTSQVSLWQVDRYVGGFNMALFLSTSIYCFASAVIHIKNCKPTICVMTIFSGGLLSLFMFICTVLWYQDDTIIVTTWLSLCFGVLKSAYSMYIVTTVYILNNTKFINLRKNECET